MSRFPSFGRSLLFVGIEKEEVFWEESYTPPEAARVVSDDSGFAIVLKFTWQGAALLDSVSTINRNRRIAIQCTFGKAAGSPRRSSASLSNGVFAFTPDATREEADRIVRDLNALIEKANKDEKL